MTFHHMYMFKSLRESFFFLFVPYLLSFFLSFFFPSFLPSHLPFFLPSLLHCFLPSPFPPSLFHVKTMLCCVLWHFDVIYWDINPFWSPFRNIFIELCVKCVLLDSVVFYVKCQTRVCVLKNCNTECLCVCHGIFPSEENLPVKYFKAGCLQNTLTECYVQSSHSSVVEDLSLLGCNTVSLNK